MTGSGHWACVRAQVLGGDDAYAAGAHGTNRTGSATLSRGQISLDCDSSHLLASARMTTRAYDMTKRVEGVGGTRRRIAAAALELFKARDFDAVSVKEIT